jgi:hypothetical protein
MNPLAFITSGTPRVIISAAGLTTINALTVTAAPTFSALTLGSVPFASTSGLIAQDNANLFWDATNARLGIGTAAPGHTLDVAGKWGARESAITLANGDNNDVAITSSFVEIDGPTSAFAITGVAGGTNGQIVTFFVNANAQCTVKYYTGSATANRIRTPTAGNIVLGGGTYFQWFTLQYSAAYTNWILLGHS